MSDNDTNATMFELSIDIAKHNQNLYHKLVEMFAPWPEVSDFWKGMERDEMYHTRTLEGIRGSLRPNQLLTPADPSILQKTKKVLNIPIEERVNSLDTLNDAYEMAHELENSEVNMIFEFLVKEFESSEETRKFALAEIDKHLEKLIKFPETFGDIEWRKSIVIRKQ